MSEDPRAPSPKEYGVSCETILELERYAEGFHSDHNRRLNSLKQATIALADSPAELPSFLAKVSLLLADLEHGTQRVLDFHSLVYGIGRTVADGTHEEAAEDFEELEDGKLVEKGAKP